MKRVIRLRTSLLVGLLALGAANLGWSQSRRPVVSSVDVQVPSPPIPVSIAGKRHLAYELQITNFRSSEITLTRVEVSDAARGSRLASFQEAELDRLLGRPGAPPVTSGKRVIGAGMRAVVYLWLPLDNAVATPSRLRHKVELDVARASGLEHTIVEAGESDVRRDRPVVLNPPLRGGPWVALYDPMMIGGHRTAIYAVNGRARIPARFAIDWVRLENDGTHARGDKSQIANWHGYSAEALAVADGAVVEAKDDIAEDPCISCGPQAPIPLENVSGNFVCLDLGGGRYAFYEHLKRGSVRVKVGDRVKSGQVIGLLGNSGGSSSGPHLHFHVADAQSELGGEGVPYVFKGFNVIGAYKEIGGFASGERWGAAAPGAGGMRIRELPAPSTVVIFPTDGRKASIAIAERLAPDNSPDAEIASWNSIKDSGNPANFRAYLDDSPRGRFRRLAENRLGEFEGPESLKKLFETIHNLIYVKKDTRSAAALLVSLFPNEERARKALKDDVPPETLQKIFDYHKQLRSLMGETNINELARPEQKIVKVHGATTEEIISYAQGSVAYTEFPGGARRIAGQIFRPGMTFYEVEFLEPGKDYGIKYHLFYWDGRQWTMLGPLWRALQ